jgi:hypothetical protein
MVIYGLVLQTREKIKSLVLLCCALLVSIVFICTYYGVQFVVHAKRTSLSRMYTHKNAQVVTGLQTSCYKSVQKLSTSCVCTACSQLL